jgi:RNA polymerase sigma factor for flagellar operon FliA
MAATNVIQLRRPPSKLDRETLIVTHVELAKRVARHAACRVPAGAAREEAISAGLLGLVEAADRFDPSRGVPFDAFARRRVLGAVLDFLRAEDPLSRDDRKKRRSGQSNAAEPEFVAFDDVAELLGGETGKFDEESMLARMRVRKVVATLPAADQRLLSLYYGEERTLREVGIQLGGVTESRICQRLSAILSRLRELLAE